MKIIILTSNELRHKFFANSLSLKSDDVLIISEYKQTNSENIKSNTTNQIDEHFKLRRKTEEIFFPNNSSFIKESLSIPYKDLRREDIFQKIKEFKPDIIFIYGSSIIKEPLLSFTTTVPTFNLHLGISPYYRGSGTNFWPFVNEELEYVGSTILYINSGIDTGNIICHTRPKIELGDDVHSIGCKVIESSVQSLLEIMKMIQKGNKPISTLQWSIDNEKYYKNSDFNEEILLKYKNNLKNGLIRKYISNTKKVIKLINLTSS